MGIHFANILVNFWIIGQYYYKCVKRHFSEYYKKPIFDAEVGRLFKKHFANTCQYKRECYIDFTNQVIKQKYSEFYKIGSLLNNRAEYRWCYNTVYNTSETRPNMLSNKLHDNHWSQTCHITISKNRHIPLALRDARRMQLDCLIDWCFTAHQHKIR